MAIIATVWLGGWGPMSKYYNSRGGGGGVSWISMDLGRLVRQVANSMVCRRYYRAIVSLYHFSTKPIYPANRVYLPYISDCIRQRIQQGAIL